jgi:hypothetical protein
MTLQPTEIQLVHALGRAEELRRTMSPSNPAQWHQYVESLRGVSLANWSATTDIQMKYALLRTIISEIR